MPRLHIQNPTVTVIMETVGRDTIADAIRSFLAQDYQEARLLILNRHPSPLVIHGIPDSHRLRISVVNDEDTYLRPVDQAKTNLKMVPADCWTVWDDDDTAEPDHISQLVAYWNTCTDRTAAPLAVCGMNYTAIYPSNTRILRFRGWQMSLFERLTPEEVDWCFQEFPQDAINGRDLWIAGNSYFDLRSFDGKPTYHWNRSRTDHVSRHELINGRTPRDKFAIALNYWRIKLDARASVPKPVNVSL